MLNAINTNLWWCQRLYLKDGQVHSNIAQTFVNSQLTVGDFLVNQVDAGLSEKRDTPYSYTSTVDTSKIYWSYKSSEKWSSETGSTGTSTPASLF